MTMDKDDQRLAARQFLATFAQKPGWVTLDTETTGPNPEEDEVIQVGIVNDRGDLMANRLFQPTCEINDGATDVHGYTMDDLEGAATIDEAVGLEWLLRQVPVLIYNADFDVPILVNSFRQRGVDVDPDQWDTRCVMNAYAMAEGQWNAQRQSFDWVSLEDAAHERNVAVPTEDALHDAVVDADVTRRIVKSFG